MKTRMQIVMSAMFVSLFVSGIASAQSHETEWVAEMSPFHTGMKYCNSANEAVYGLQCAGPYCAAINGPCKSPGLSFSSNSYQAGPYSDGDGPFYCDYNYVVTGFDVDGWDNFGDNITLNCAELNITLPYDQETYPDYDTYYCEWTDWISEEKINDNLDPNGTTWSNFGGLLDDVVLCPSTILGFPAVVHGMECDGAYCDNMRLYCCSYR